MQNYLETPCAMRHPPELDPFLRTTPPSPRHALLINPFYPKDPRASFGKHVLTPTLNRTGGLPALAFRPHEMQEERPS